MGNLMSCVLICGAMEVVHVVHADGRIEKLIRPVRSSDLAEPSPKAITNGGSEGPELGGLSIPQQAEMRSGQMYFLLPIRGAHTSSWINYKRLAAAAASKISGDCQQKKTPATCQNCEEMQKLLDAPPFRVKQEGGVTKLVVSKKYLQQILAEKAPSKSDQQLQHQHSSRADGASHRSHHHHPQQKKQGQNEQPPSESKGESRSRSSTSSSSSNSKKIPRQTHNVAPKTTSAVSGPRPSIWRPALESIAEVQNKS